MGNSLVQPVIQKIKEEITRKVGESLGLGSPLLLDQRTAFAAAPDVADFHPTRLSPRSAQDLEEPLPPGDYSVPVTAFCTQWSIHQPGQGLPYKIGTVQGKAAPAISALIVRGTLQNISPSTLNAEAWRIEAGVPLRQWPEADQALAHKLIPDHEKDIAGDYLQQAHEIYDKNTIKSILGHRFKIPGVPPFEK